MPGPSSTLARSTTSEMFRVSQQRRPFLLRIDPAVLEAVQRWADDDLRSLNGQIEYLLRRALQEADRARPKESKKSEEKKA